MPFTTLVDCDRLARHIGDPGWRIFDCRFDLADTGRGRRAHAEAHVPGAYYAHLDDVLSSPVSAESGRHPLPEISRLSDWLGRHGVTAGVQVVVYDDAGGSIAARLWWLLRWLGHADVAVLDGGWTQWTARGQATESTGPPSPRQAIFSARPDWGQVMTTEDVLAAAKDGLTGLTLVDVRASERFAGITEPIDAVAGHVPGAINIPYMQFLDPDQRFRRLSALRDVLGSAIGDRRGRDVVAMCGSGVTACHALLALEIAGLASGRLYGGSWSEWIRDPSRPVATTHG